MSTTIVTAARLAGCTAVERALVMGSLEDALRLAVEAEEQDSRATLRPGASS